MQLLPHPTLTGNRLSCIAPGRTLSTLDASMDCTTSGLELASEASNDSLNKWHDGPYLGPGGDSYLPSQDTVFTGGLRNPLLG